MKSQVSFDSKRFQDVATYLLEEASLDDREALDRTAIGRLYYAAFLNARRFLLERGIRAPTVGSVVARLDAIPELGGISADLGLLHALRNRCDYDDSNDLGRANVEWALRLANRIRLALAPHW